MAIIFIPAPQIDMSTSQDLIFLQKQNLWNPFVRILENWRQEGIHIL